MRYGITNVTFSVTVSEGVKAQNCSLRATGGMVTRGKVSQKSQTVSLPVRVSKPRTAASGRQEAR